MPLTRVAARLTASDPLDARQLLLPYLVGLLGLCTALQLAIALAGSEIGLVAYVLSAAVAAYYLAYSLRFRDKLRRVRFAPLVAHAITYAVVCGSFLFHAAILAIANADALRGGSGLPIDGGWFGPTLAMGGFWAAGLVVHAIASVVQRGFED